MERDLNVKTLAFMDFQSEAARGKPKPTSQNESNRPQTLNTSLIRETPSSSGSSSSKVPSDESPGFELPNIYWLKCTPRRRCTPPTPSSAGSSPKDEEPNFILKIEVGNEPSIHPRARGQRKSRSAERSRSYVGNRLSRSAERAKSSEGSSQSDQRRSRSTTRSTYRHGGERRRFRSRLRRLFTSEDNLLHKMALRFQNHVVYCSWLCFWYRVVKEYTKVSDGIQKMNRENR